MLPCTLSKFAAALEETLGETTNVTVTLNVHRVQLADAVAIASKLGTSRPTIYTLPGYEGKGEFVVEVGGEDGKEICFFTDPPKVETPFGSSRDEDRLAASEASTDDLLDPEGSGCED